MCTNYKPLPIIVQPTTPKTSLDVALEIERRVKELKSQLDLIHSFTLWPIEQLSDADSSGQDEAEVTE